MTKPTSSYDANTLHVNLLSALGNEAPALIFSGPTGVGKSTVLASVPVPDGKERRAFDHENSMKAVDGGPDGQDTYSKRFQKFRMVRKRLPKLGEYNALFTELKSGKHNIGAVMIDNIAILQELMGSAIQLLSAKPAELKRFLAGWDVPGTAFPRDGTITKWANDVDAKYWDILKQPFKNLILLCQQQNVILVGSTEEGNIWQNYGQTGQKIVGKKAKLLDAWLRYTDAVIFLARDSNVAGPPKGSINPAQPKMRIQGLNPTWVMDWPNFVKELEAAKTRFDEEIPVELRASTEIVSEEPETTKTKE